MTGADALAARRDGDGISNPMAEATFPGRLSNLADTRSDDVAFQEKRYGIWHTWSWSAYERRVQAFAHALDSLGVVRGDALAVIADNRPEWLIAELAAQAIGAAVVGVYPASTPAEVEHVLATARVRVAVAEDEEQVDKLAKVRDSYPHLDAVIFFNPRGLEERRDPWLHEFADLERYGEKLSSQSPSWYETCLAKLTPDETAIICTTSGTTARPKLAELTHRNLLEMGHRFLSVEPVGPNARYVSFLPFAWVGEQMLAVACGLQAGFPLSFPESPQTQETDMREIGPDLMFSPPTIWEGMVSRAQVSVSEADWLKRRAFAWGFRIAWRVSSKKMNGEAPSLWARIRLPFARLVALRPMREQLGLTRLERGYTGGAPLGPDVFQFFHTIGVNLKQIYGQTEIAGIAVAHRDGDVHAHTVGVCLPGTELQIAPDGEVLLRSPAVFAGYRNNPEATHAAVDDEGWLHTGDAGYIEDQSGHLVIVDRLKDVRQTRDGTRFSPAFIENRLKFSSYFDQAVIDVSEDGSRIVALVVIDYTATSVWAERSHIAFTTFSDLSQNPDVLGLLQLEIARANAGLPEAIQVERFASLHKELDADDDEITRTRKVRRDIVFQRYNELFEALRVGQESADVRSRVTYQDGRSTERTLALELRPVPDANEDSTRDLDYLLSGF